eukprot:TRINITY_DN14561_c0_g1_i1.p1 TRINITY_DN14561_c0_g1~~TRINITY_DN14561_c0_g1_i1.p1  ORF type:complete len:231 (+),score=50.59 TRINITY_DN14561_c0_g1_i1:593-1285(+)
MHLGCLSQEKVYNPAEPYTCPRHEQRAKAMQSKAQGPPSGFKPPEQYLQQFPRSAQGSAKPGFEKGASKALAPHNVNKKSVEEHASKKEEIKANEEKNLQEKFYAESKEIMEEMTNSLNKLVEQHGKQGKNEKFKTDEEKDWNILDGKDLYSLSQGNIKKRIKKFGRQFRTKVKVKGSASSRRKTRGSRKMWPSSRRRCGAWQRLWGGSCRQGRSRRRLCTAVRRSLSKC